MVHASAVVTTLFALVAFAPAAASAAPREGHAASPNASVSMTEKVNINTADVKQLMALTGVGHKLAEKIVEYRDAHGPFKKAEEIRKVDGLGTGLWEKNRERIVVK